MGARYHPSVFGDIFCTQGRCKVAARSLQCRWKIHLYDLLDVLDLLDELHLCHPPGVLELPD